MAILIVDDEPTRHKAISKMHTGHLVASAYTAHEATEWLRRLRFEHVYLDHDLGPRGGTGLAVAREIVSLPEHMRPGMVTVHTMNPVGADSIMKTLWHSNQAAIRVPFSLLV